MDDDRTTYEILSGQVPLLVQLISAIPAKAERLADLSPFNLPLPAAAFNAVKNFAGPYYCCRSGYAEWTPTSPAQNQVALGLYVYTNDGFQTVVYFAGFASPLPIRYEYGPNRVAVDLFAAPNPY